jgi:CHAP domain
MGGGHPLSLGKQITTYAHGKLRQQVGSGECYDLADKALHQAGALSAPHYGTITDDADYVWGKEVATKDAQPGDIIQFRDYTETTETVTVTRTTKTDGSWTEKTKTETQSTGRPHHTAVVESVDGDGKFTVLEQNVKPAGAARAIRKVQRNKLFTKGSKTTLPRQLTHGKGGAMVEVKKTVTVTVEGTIWFYRPQTQ